MPSRLNSYHHASPRYFVSPFTILNMLLSPGIKTAVHQSPELIQSQFTFLKIVNSRFTRNKTGQSPITKIVATRDSNECHMHFLARHNHKLHYISILYNFQIAASTKMAYSRSLVLMIISLYYKLARKCQIMTNICCVYT